MTDHVSRSETSPLRVYVASSWRNSAQPAVVLALRDDGHEVYDFRDPVADAGFVSDMDALNRCDVCVLVLPCGRSAHLEAGWAAGAGKLLIVLLADGEPDLMWKIADRLCITLSEVRRALVLDRHHIARRAD